MKIKVKAAGNFLHGRYCFQANGQYIVPDRRGGVFVSNGWADELPDNAEGEFVTVTDDELQSDAPKAAAGEVTLDVQDVHHESGV